MLYCMSEKSERLHKDEKSWVYSKKIMEEGAYVIIHGREEQKGPTEMKKPGAILRKLWRGANMLYCLAERTETVHRDKKSRVCYKKIVAADEYGILHAEKAERGH